MPQIVTNAIRSRTLTPLVQKIQSKKLVKNSKISEKSVESIGSAGSVASFSQLNLSGMHLQMLTSHDVRECTRRRSCVALMDDCQKGASLPETNARLCLLRGLHQILSEWHALLDRLMPPRRSSSAAISKRDFGRSFVTLIRS